MKNWKFQPTFDHSGDEIVVLRLDPLWVLTQFCSSFFGLFEVSAAGGHFTKLLSSKFSNSSPLGLLQICFTLTKLAKILASFSRLWWRLTRRGSNAREWESKSDSSQENSCKEYEGKELAHVARKWRLSFKHSNTRMQPNKLLWTKGTKKRIWSYC